MCPATEKHVKKYQRQESFLVEETGEDYKTITLPYIQKQSFSVQVSASMVNSSGDIMIKMNCVFFNITFTLTVGTQHPGEEGGG